DRLSSLAAVRTRRRRPNQQELTSRMPSEQIANALSGLDVPFDTRYDTTAALDALRKAPSEERGALRRPDGVAQPLDALLATSMLQVGVDVQRLGIMLVTGQPKNTAEYIQATSRVGRDPSRPGLVLTIYQWARPRDLAHCESFSHYHNTFGSLVEGLTTTPFSDRALDRGLSAVLVAAMRHHADSNLPNAAAHTVPLDGAMVSDLLDDLERRAGRVTHDQVKAAQVREKAQNRIDDWTRRRTRLATGLLGYQAGRDVTGLLKPPDDGTWERWTAPRSLREVEPEVLLQLEGSDRSVDSAPLWTYDSHPVDAEPEP
ncbi:MAG TPA: helicase-related protein, partial [Candidatus Saccharimonadales bacterium]|nr:helicase-related protein [Candidatus Saccharimonadales bacterium]